MELSKFPHNKFSFQGLDEKTYTKYAGIYSKCKKYSFRGISAFVAGTGVKSALFEVRNKALKDMAAKKSVFSLWVPAVTL